MSVTATPASLAPDHHAQFIELLQASLEVYSPLDNVELRAGADVANLAQSMTAARVQIGAH